VLLTNEFVVARPIDQTWAVLTDIERIAPCMPGAQLTAVRGDEYDGKVKVKVGPMTAQFSGTATFKDRDAVAHRAVIEAKGRDATGKGRASALVTAVLVDEGSSTRVKVETDLSIAGPLAQMGRSTIGDISTRLLTQFVENLEQQLANEESGPAAAAPTVEPVASELEAPVAVPVVAASAPEPATVSDSASVSASGSGSASEPASASVSGLEPASVSGSVEAAVAETVASVAPVPVVADAAGAPTAPAEQAATKSTGVRLIDGPEVEAVDLTKIAGKATLVKIAIPVVVVVVIILALIFWAAA